jgi:hypothetical protein
MFVVYDGGTGEELLTFDTLSKAKTYGRNQYYALILNESTGDIIFYDPEIGGWVSQ